MFDFVQNYGKFDKHQYLSVKSFQLSIIQSSSNDFLRYPTPRQHPDMCWHIQDSGEHRSEDSRISVFAYDFAPVMLPGTVLRRTSCELGLCFSPLPPYEILKTPSISPDELEVAMQISRMIDLYYNSSAWQNVTRSLVLSSPAFVRKFTSYLAERMVLDSPVSLERRGSLLYEYCSQFYPQMLQDISIAWIEAGFSLKKEPAGKIVRIKHIDAFIEENGSKFIVKYGRTDPSYRYYHMKSGAKNVLFGYSSEVHSPAPVFMAFL